YHSVLGFDVVASLPSALFVSAGGYHHHIGMNTWHSAGAGTPPPGIVKLSRFGIVVSSKQALLQVAERLESASIYHQVDRGVLTTKDPGGIPLEVQVADASPD